MELLALEKWQVQVVIAPLCVLGVIVFIVAVMLRRRRQWIQHQRAVDTARKLYGVGRPRYKPQRNFLSNMRIVIRKFSEQRRDQQYQFAVMFFVQQEIKALEDIYINWNFNFWNKNSGRQLLCNYDVTYWPETDKFYNYMVSRHDNPNHAEEIIFNQFLELWDRYLRRMRMKKPSFIILYSWLMLCSRCTQKLIDLIKDDSFKPTQFVVVYTIPAWDGELEDVAEASREKLLSAGIRVYHVTYDEYLPPGEEPPVGETQQAINLGDEVEFPAL